MRQTNNLILRSKAAATHLGMSALTAAAVAAIVFGLWYPWPYSKVSGGIHLLLLVLSVDLALGPLLTFIVFDRSKTRAHLARDIAVIVLLQLIGLGYGLHTVYLARPVAVVFEVNQFRVVSDVQVMHSELDQAPQEFRELSLTGPKLLSARRPVDGKEKLRAIDLALQGFDVGTRPSYWQSYDKARQEILERARSVAVLYQHYSASSAEINQAVSKTGRNSAELKFLPLLARETNWSVLLDAKTAEIVGFVRLDGYF